MARVKPLVGYLRRILHEEQINKILENHANKPPLEFIAEALKDMRITYETTGLDHLDDHGRYIFAANHPFGGLDGLMLAESVAARFGDVRVVVNDILMNVAPLRPIFVPVSRLGRQNADYARLYADTFASDLPIITFPAGKCSRRRNGTVCDTEWHSSFIRQAVASQRDVVPVFFDGRLSNFFYNVANLRTGLGLHTNIEMLWLTDEMFRQQGRHFHIKIGRPIPFGEFMNGASPHIHAERVKEEVYKL